MGKVEERAKLEAKLDQLFVEKEEIQAQAFQRWHVSFEGLSVEQARTRYFTQRVFTDQEQVKIDAIMAKIENISETIKTLDQAISRDNKPRMRVLLEAGRHCVEPEYNSKW